MSVIDTTATAVVNAKNDSVALRKAFTAYRDHMATRFSIDIHDEAAWTEWMLKGSKLLAQTRGEEDIEKKPAIQVPPINDPENAQKLIRCFFYVKPDDRRVAKEILRKAYSMDFYPNARPWEIEIEGSKAKVFRFSIYFCSFTSADKLRQRFPDLFVKIEADNRKVRTN